MRFYSATILSLILTCSFAVFGQEKIDISLVKIDELHPTQVSVGMLEVQAKVNSDEAKGLPGYQPFTESYDLVF